MTAIPFSPTVVNTFGIPVMRDRVGGEPEVQYINGQPLCPWRFTGHQDLYVAVDDTEIAYQTFRDELAEVNDLAARGRVVVVDGVEGSGKTALIHRCVNDLQNRLAKALGRAAGEGSRQAGRTGLKPPVPGVTIVDLSEEARKVGYDDKGQLCPLDGINQNIFTKIIGKVRNDLASGVVARLEEMTAAGGRLIDLYQELSTLMRDRQHFVLVILPFIRLGLRQMHIDFLRSYVNFSERHIVFFAETTEPDLMDAMRMALSYEDEGLLTHLSVGRLNNGDWMSFIEERMKRPGLPTPHVTVPSETLANVPVDIQYETVRLLQNTFFELGEIARWDGRAEISEHDFITQATQRRHNLLRRRPQSRRGRDHRGER